jgi:hypothetical protein
VALAGPGPFLGSRPAEVILTGTGRPIAYAPKTPQQLEFRWGPRGLFEIETGAGDNPSSWNGYVGSVRAGQLARPIAYYGASGAVNPAGTAIAMQDGRRVSIFPVRPPACEYTSGCLHFPPKYLVNAGQLIAWAP